MKYSDEVWIQKRNRRIAAYVLLDGTLLLGAPFAVIMPIAGYFNLRGSSRTFSEYLVRLQRGSHFSDVQLYLD
jgi:hypothetical protein